MTLTAAGSGDASGIIGAGAVLDVGLARCSVGRPLALSGGVEITLATDSLRSFPVRYSPGLGVCVKYGAAHRVTVDGRPRLFPADQVAVRMPGCVWSSDPGRHGFASIDVAVDLLPEVQLGGGMTFVSPDALPDVGRWARALLRAEDRLQAEQLVAVLVAGVVGLSEVDLARSGRATNHRAVDAALDHLRANVVGRPSLDELAAASGMNKFSLLRRFRREIGLTPHAYLVALRTARARDLLGAGATPAEAAIGAGFADQAHMGRWFRRDVGVTPAAYARELRSIPFQTRTSGRQQARRL